MSEDPKWKTELLSASLPLEFEAARLLVSKGFRVDSDFKYARTDSDLVKDSSVDLHARASAPFADPNQVTGTLALLLECKHRPPDVNWLFLPNPNQPGGSPPTHGRTLRIVDKFSPYSVDAGATAAFDAELPLCYKGLEVNVANGQVDESDFRHGLAQLQYALPRLLVETVFFHLGGRSSENVPFLFCPVLLTTAPLLMASENLSVEKVEQSSELRDLATEVPYLAIHSDYGPDFQSHCGREFKAMESLERADNLLMVERRRAGRYRSQRELPVATIEALVAADRHWLQSLFTQFIVCTRSELPNLVDKIKEAAASAVQLRKELQ